MATFLLRYQLGEVEHVLHMVEARLEDATVLANDWLLLMIRSTQLNFDAQGRAQRWDDLAPSTERRRFAKAMRGAGSALGSLATLGSLQILRDEGLLMQSLGAGAVGPFQTADGGGETDTRSAALFTNRPGADALQTGYAPHNLPGREYVLFQEQDIDDATTMADDFVMGQGAYQQ